MPELCAQQLTVAIGGVTLIRDLSLTLQSGELIAIVGENGSGKSTLLRAMAGYLRPTVGGVSLGGVSVTAMPARQRGRAIAWLPQVLPPAWPTTVHDAVAIGRYAHGGLPSRLRGADAVAVADALDRCHLADLRDADVSRLSGGELARVHLARTIVGAAPILLADEPVAALDPRHRLSVMRLLRDLANAGRGVAVVLHDLALAARFADRIIGLKEGRLAIEGTPHAVITAATIRDLFGVEAEISHAHGWPMPILLP